MNIYGCLGWRRGGFALPLCCSGGVVTHAVHFVQCPATAVCKPFRNGLISVSVDAYCFTGEVSLLYSTLLYETSTVTPRTLHDTLHAVWQVTIWLRPSRRRRTSTGWRRARQHQRRQHRHRYQQRQGHSETGECTHTPGQMEAHHLRHWHHSIDRQCFVFRAARPFAPGHSCTGLP